MIVCSCNRVSDRVVRKVVRDGAPSVSAIARATGAGTCCGSCAGGLRTILLEERARGASDGQPTQELLAAK